MKVLPKSLYFMWKMKKIVYILLLLVSVVSCKTSQKIKSENPNYKPLEYFGTDTLAFYKYNFEEHKDFYIGKEMSYMINDMGEDVNLCPIFKYDKEYRADCIKGVYLFLEPEGDVFVSDKGYSDNIIVWLDKNEYLLEESYHEKRRKEKEIISKNKKVKDVQTELNHKLRDYFFSDKKVKDIEVGRIYRNRF